MTTSTTSITSNTTQSPISGIPSWLDRTEYPFCSHFTAINGHHLHYVDEGQGDVLLMVHGTPVWSFLYRHCIKTLSPHYRCIALDHLGFGLSEKPVDADYSPKAHARRLEQFVEHLGLKRVTLITQDYGGPISLDYAGRNPDTVERLVIANSWMWLLPRLEQGGKLFNTALGKWLYLRYGFSPKVMIPQAYGNRKLLTPAIHRHYFAPLSTPEERLATFALVKAFTEDRGWYQEIATSQQRLADKPVLMLWGKKDRFVPYHLMMPLWKNVWRNAQYVDIPEAGHFIEEEAPKRVTEEIRKFLQTTRQL